MARRALRRRLSRGKRWLGAGVVGLLAGVAVWAHWRGEADAPPPEAPRYLVARRDLSPGEPLHFPDLAMAKLGSAVPGGLTDQDLHLLKGARVNRAIARGEAITLDTVSLAPQLTGMARSVPRGHRAYLITTSFPVPASPGDRVDVLVTPPGESEIPDLVAEAALVLHSRGRAGFGETLVAVPASRIPWLEKAQQRGKLTLVLRNPQEAPRQAVPAGPTWFRAPRRRPPVPVWEE